MDWSLMVYCTREAPVLSLLGVWILVEASLAVVLDPEWYSPQAIGKVISSLPLPRTM
jgi:hypothetical protein